MKYFVKEKQIDSRAQKTAGVKARDDVNVILQENGWTPVVIESDLQTQEKREKANAVQKLRYHSQVRDRWKEKLAVCGAGDVLLIQFPILAHSIWIFRVIRHLQASSVRVALLIHDLELFRSTLRADRKRARAWNFRVSLEERTILQSADYVIVHNHKMREAIRPFGVENSHIIELGIFDYLMPGADTSKIKAHADAAFTKDGPVVIAGTLRRHKAGYAYRLPDNYPYNLYGVGYEHQQDNVRYFGAFPPDDLPFALSGSFGLIWDGDSADTCAGVYGQYLKINDPHKTSLYLAAGLPVAIWQEAALAPFVRAHHCGILIRSLSEIPEKIRQIPEEEYNEMKVSALQLSEKMRAGGFTLEALSKVR